MFFKKDLVLGQEYLAFLLLNLFDLFLTGWIFKHHGLEANGLANWILTNPNLGLRGFALYKFLMVVVLIVICEVIAAASIRKARIVITIGCLVYLLVVFWESYLIITNIDFPSPQKWIHGHRVQDSLLPVQQWIFSGAHTLALSSIPFASRNG